VRIAGNRRAQALLAGLFVVGGTAALQVGEATAAFPGTNGKIAFTSDRDGDNEIFVVDPDGQNETPLTANSVSDVGPAFSPDGERIAFVSTRDGDGEIFVMDADGGNQAQLTFNSADDGTPSYFPDGRIAFSSNRDGDGEIFVMDADGGTQTQLTFNAGEDSEPTVSADGARIAFRTNEQISIMDSSGQNPVTLTAGPALNIMPAFSPDGQKIVFRSDRTSVGEIFVMGADGQNQVPLTTVPGIDNEPSFSPDGQKVVFNSARSGDSEIFVMDADGQNQVPLTENAFGDFGSNSMWQPLNPPQCDLSAGSKQKSARKIVVGIACQNENAAVVVEGTVRVPKLLRTGGAAAKSKTYALVPVSAQVAAGEAATLELTVPKRPRKKLKAAFEEGRKGSATLAATATDDLGQGTQDSDQVKLKKRKK
jgi:dipeptidyl aminopeptidase/acylaminoacyl peptidase